MGTASTMPGWVGCLVTTTRPDRGHRLKNCEDTSSPSVTDLTLHSFVDCSTILLNWEDSAVCFRCAIADGERHRAME